ncbi:MAG: hypothetical protein ACJA0N_000300 [Pseudohongiellaceae bacterium]|jgi:hypothetical protein
MNKKNLRLIGILFATVFTFSCVQAETSGYYRWKDQEGNLKLSDRPPAAGIEARFVETLGSRKSRYSSTTSTEVTSTPDSAQPKESLKMEILPEKDPERCKQAQENITALEGYTRIRVTDDDGTQRLLTEDEKNVQVERSKKAISDNCN